MSRLVYIKQEAINFLKRLRTNKPHHPQINSALKKDGIYIVPNFMTPSACAELRGEIDRLILKFESKIQTDSFGADQRAYGADRVSEKFSEYFKDQFLRQVITEFQLGTSVQGFSLAARLNYKEGNLGSGNGWHRDSANYSQGKSIVYLSSVGTENGPFQYIIGSHTPSAFVRGLMKKVFHYDQFRYSDQEVMKYLECFPKQKLVTFTAEEGTLIFADTRGIHRGKPIEKGTRYAATNYFFIDRVPAPHLLEYCLK